MIYQPLKITVLLERRIPFHLDRNQCMKGLYYATIVRFLPNSHEVI